MGYGALLPDGGATQVAGLAALAIALFATRVLPEAVTAFVVILLALALGVASEAVVFSGFASGGVWLMLAGIVLGAAIVATGLAARLADGLYALTGGAPARAVLVVGAAGLALGVLIPSTIPRVIVLLPVAAALAERLGHAPESRVGIALGVMATTATLLPTYMILTANLPTIVHVGVMEKLYAFEPSYSGYFLAQTPVNALRFAVLAALLALPLLTAARPTEPPAGPAGGAVRLDRAQRRLLGVLAVAIVFWATDFAHGIAPAWIALAAAAVVLWPPAGMLDGKAMRERIDLSPIFFLAALFAVSAVAREVGLDRALADALILRLGIGEGESLRSIYAIFLFTFLIGHLTTAPAAPVVLGPFAEPLAQASGLSLEAVFAVQIVGIASPVLPHQAPPLLLAMSLAAIPAWPLIRACAAVALAVGVLGLPLCWLWWRAIGLV